MINKYQFTINDTHQFTFSPKSGLNLEIGKVDSEGKFFPNKKTYIGNFVPVLTSCVNLKSDEEIIEQVELFLEFTDGSIHNSVVLSLEELSKVDWSRNVDPRCILNPNVPKVKSHIDNVIRLQYGNKSVTSETVTCIKQIGGNFVEKIPVFHAGNELIWPDNVEENHRPKVDFKPVPNMKLAINPDCSEKDADSAMARIVALSPDAGQAILSLNLVCIQWNAFVKAGITPRCNMYLYGPTGAKKTTYAAFTTQIYNRHNPLEYPNRLNTSIPAVLKLIEGVRHGVLVLDDLYPADSAEIRRKQEKTLLEITRIIADGTEPARVNGREIKKRSPCCGILGTGEYYIGEGSDAARLFPVEIKAPINTNELTACQNEPLMLSTYYWYYIKWYVSKFYEIVDLLKTWKTTYWAQVENIAGHDRLKETQFCFMAGYRLYLTYRKEKGFITIDESIKLDSLFRSQLNTIIEKQNERIKQGRSNISSPQTDYLEILRSLYLRDKIVLVNKPQNFCEGSHDGVIHKDHLYIRPKSLENIIRHSNPDATLNEIVLSLQWKHALTTGNKKTKQLYGAGKGLRFYAIKLSKLS